MEIYQNEKELLDETNRKLIEELSKNHIKKLIISSIGNSISTGFSMCNSSTPLLKRNETLKNHATNGNIFLETHQFAREENNSDEHTLNAFNQNKKESRFNRESRRDYNAYIEKNMPLLTESEIDYYYPEKLEEDKGMQDTIFESGDSIANFVIYNGGTGPFLDNLTRKGKHFLNGISKDVGSIESILSKIQFNNRQNYGKTQVYLCGAPRIALPLASTLAINTRLKTIADRYANVTYIPNFSRKYFYSTKNSKIKISDPHYNENEYLHLLNEVEKRMIENYIIKECIIEVDRIFSKISQMIEMKKIDPQKYNEKFILNILDYYKNIVKQYNCDEIRFIKEIRIYLLERYSYDFSYLDYNSIKHSSKKLIK